MGPACECRQHAQERQASWSACGGPRRSPGPGVATMEGLTGVGMAKGMEVERVGSVYRSLRPG